MSILANPEILMSGEREAVDPDLNRKDPESQVTFEDHTSMSLDKEDTDSDTKRFEEDDHMGSNQDEEEGESSPGNAVGRISAEMDTPGEIQLVFFHRTLQKPVPSMEQIDFSETIFEGSISLSICLYKGKCFFYYCL